MATLALSPSALNSFKLAKVFSDNTARVNALSFTPDGEFLISSGDDDALHLYKIQDGMKKKTILSKKYGAAEVRFTHHKNSILFASNNNSWDDTIRYHSLHDNQYLRFFKGHRNKVISLEMSPTNDAFLSGSLDNTVRLWDLRSNVCQGMIRLATQPQVSYDPQGLIFAVATPANGVKLYDVRSFDKGPFATFRHDLNYGVHWTGMKFSADGKYILLSSNSSKLICIDSFEGNLTQSYSSTKLVNRNASKLEASFTPDGQYVMSGSEDGKIVMWEALSGKYIGALEGHTNPSACVKFSPTRCLIASACTKVGFWVPDMKMLK